MADQSCHRVVRTPRMTPESQCMEGTTPLKEVCVIEQAKFGTTVLKCTWVRNAPLSSHCSFSFCSLLSCSACWGTDPDNLAEARSCLGQNLVSLMRIIPSHCGTFFGRWRQMCTKDNPQCLYSDILLFVMTLFLLSCNDIFIVKVTYFPALMDTIKYPQITVDNLHWS